MLLSSLSRPADDCGTAAGDAHHSGRDQQFILDTPAEDVFDDLVAAVARRLGTRHAELSIVTPARVWLKAGTTEQGVDRDPADTFCARVAADRRTIVVPDARRSARFAAHSRVRGRNGLRFYAGVPLITSDGAVLGALCAWDERPHHPTADDIAALTHLGRDAVAALELRRANGRLEAAQSLLDACATVTELIVSGAELPLILDTLARSVEQAIPSTSCSILVLEGGVLHHGAAPSLPASYRNAIVGVPIGPAVGSCGTAAYRREPVLVGDIATDPLWTDYRQYALPTGLRACWSVPIVSPQQQVLGTFALYYHTVRNPTGDELSDLSRWVNLAELAIGRAGEVALLREAATVDMLTGLMNRAEGLRTLQGLTDDVSTPMALLFVDLDQFALVNDTMGHAAGDAFLKEVAVRLTGCVRPQDTVARFGGDEFLVLCPGISSAEEARALGGRIIAALAEPMGINGNTLALSASVGISLHPPASGKGSDDLISEADLAMYAAKKSGRNCVAVFDGKLRSEAAARLRLEGDLSRALPAGELSCVYQPVVDLQTGELLAVEALLRWHSPTRGVVPPLEFVPAAEDSGLIIALGEFVLRQACAQIARWNADPILAGVTVWVNISPRQLRDAHFADVIEAILTQTSLPATQLGVEVTESTLVQDSRIAGAALTRLRRMGVRVAVDDFGTGYSSLAQLKNLPVDVLKIDQQFVGQLSTSGADAGIVQAIITLAGTVGLDVTAEGIETLEQADALRALGCRTGQGFLFGRPCAPADLGALITAGAR